MIGNKTIQLRVKKSTRKKRRRGSRYEEKKEGVNWLGSGSFEIRNFAQNNISCSTLYLNEIL